jgi:hypothetical protein
MIFARVNTIIRDTVVDPPQAANLEVLSGYRNYGPMNSLDHQRGDRFILYIAFFAW